MHFSCQWGWENTADANGRGGGAAYPASFTVDPSARTATHAPAAQGYALTAITTEAVWLLKTITSDSAINIVTIRRSPEGGAWTDTVLNSDGTATVVSGGYCMESEN
ncbi:hypothetical protein ACJ5NV_02910 [Loktanella agnita]|uniref:hypothetical protein n=1 Tax=Loktanella agnita TaxID=287097 RepID=UPI0039880FA7